MRTGSIFKIFNEKNQPVGTVVITPDGESRFRQPTTAHKGCFTCFEGKISANYVLLSSDYRNAELIAAKTGREVFTAFSEDNLKTVQEKLSTKYPYKTILMIESQSDFEQAAAKLKDEKEKPKLTAACRLLSKLA
jgi:phage/plasmid primase-like uncharacterized protein